MIAGWAIAPATHRPRKRFNRCWNYCRARGVIAVGWELDRAPATREDLRLLWENRSCPDWSLAHRGMLEAFWFDIQPGDCVVARAGMSHVVGIGEVTGAAFLDLEAQGKAWGCNLLPVRWDLAVPLVGKVRVRPRFFPQRAIVELSDEKLATIRELSQALGKRGSMSVSEGEA